MAIISLALIAVSFVACGPVATIPGAIMGKMELGRIARGESPEAGKLFAQLGFWGNLVLSGFWVLGICLYLGFIFLVVGGAAASGY